MHPLSPNVPVVPNGPAIHKAMREFFRYDQDSETLLDLRKSPPTPAHIVRSNTALIHVPTIGRIPYARALWLYFYEQCPKRLVYADGDSSNVSINNLQAPCGRDKPRKPPRRPMPELTQWYMRKLFTYQGDHGYLLDAVTGEKKCFTSKGRKFVYLPRGQVMTAARAVWLYHYEALPAGRIQFKDRNPLNCRVDNLTIDGMTLQQHSDKREYSHSMLWGKHVTLYKRTGKYRARVNGKHLGYYDTEQEANAVVEQHVEHLQNAPLITPQS